MHVPRQMHIEKVWIVLRMKYLWYSPVRHAHGAGQWVVRIAVHLTGILYTRSCRCSVAHHSIARPVFHSVFSSATCCIFILSDLDDLFLSLPAVPSCIHSFLHSLVLLPCSRYSDMYRLYPTQRTAPRAESPRQMTAPTSVLLESRELEYTRDRSSVSLRKTRNYGTSLSRRLLASRLWTRVKRPLSTRLQVCIPRYY